VLVSELYRNSIDIQVLNGKLVIALVRSHAVYKTPRSQHDTTQRTQRDLIPCNADLYEAPVNELPDGHKLPHETSELCYSITYFYVRLLVLRCYEDYNLRHDTQPINLDESIRTYHPHIEAIYRRRLELLTLKQDLVAYLGRDSLLQKHSVNSHTSEPVACLSEHNVHDHVTDIEMLITRYDANISIYEWKIRSLGDWYKGTIASEQLDEARESKATAVSLGKLSTLAFLYLPLNSVCALLGMNLSIYGQGEVPVWVFLGLVILFCFLTYLPLILPKVDPRKVRVYRLAYRLTWHSPLAAFWFLAFYMTHTLLQTFEIMNFGLAQELLGYKGQRTKGWTNDRSDNYFDGAIFGNLKFWKGKIDIIFLAVPGINSPNEPTQLTV
jgi:hypothetical protein